jgi:hypothetical protein
VVDRLRLLHPDAPAVALEAESLRRAAYWPALGLVDDG